MELAKAATPPAYHLLIKPTGATCNLDCQYCFFLSKEALYPGSQFRMPEEVLETTIKQLLESHQSAEVTLAWQGGEPTLMGLDFFKRSVDLVEAYRRPEQRVRYTMQTNGTRLDDDWCAFFKEHDFLIGLSIDGPRDIHDMYRVDKGGAGTYDQVLRGWDALTRSQVEANILCTVHAANAGRPLDVYQFFRDELGAGYIQFIPIVERVTADLLPLANEGWGERNGGQRPLYLQRGSLVTGRSVKAEQYGRFLVEIFKEWVRRDVGRVYVQLFDVTLGNWIGQPSLCVFSPTCGNSLALEHNGDLYACDHYVEPDYLLGNIGQTKMIDLIGSDRQRQFGVDKAATLPSFCQECEVRFACHGGCPKNRFIRSPRGEPGLNYLCEGYKRFFNHVQRPMAIMANLLRAQRPPAEIMRLYAAEDAAGDTAPSDQLYAKTARNDPCPCGSGRKFKHCHGQRVRR